MYKTTHLSRATHHERTSLVKRCKTFSNIYLIVLYMFIFPIHLRWDDYSGHIIQIYKVPTPSNALTSQPTRHRLRFVLVRARNQPYLDAFLQLYICLNLICIEATHCDAARLPAHVCLPCMIWSALFDTARTPVDLCAWKSRAVKSTAICIWIQWARAFAMQWFNCWNAPPPPKERWCRECRDARDTARHRWRRAMKSRRRAAVAIHTPTHITRAIRRIWLTQAHKECVWMWCWMGFPRRWATLGFV